MKVDNKVNETDIVDMAPRTEMGKDGFFCYYCRQGCDSGAVKFCFSD